jgi:predicted ATPase/class 3 adenylate cyclase
MLVSRTPIRESFVMAFTTPRSSTAPADELGVAPGDLPAGDVTFFFSDIEGSTRAWELHRTAMPAALARHQGVVRGAIDGSGGTVVKDTGDGVFAVFPSTRAAVLAAVEAQRGLRATQWGETGPLRARMGLHTGEAEPEQGDYHGVPVNRCARIMGVAHGGQVLVSEAAYQRVALDPPPHVSFLDLGPHRLRDLSVAVRLWQVRHPDIDADFPALRSLDVLPNNLPALPSSLVGRGQELAELAEVLSHTRLLTLVGAGGVGKTRLALQLAADLADHFTDGVWFVDLAGLGEPELVPQAVASALRIGEQSGRPWIDSVLWYLRDRHVLLLVDNCEHLITAVASLTRQVLEGCPGVKVLATSREALHTPGEVAWSVPSLPLPNGVTTSDAERLFLVRAGEADPRYRPDGADRDAVAQICARLDGLPLAIELAAARVRVLSATEIAARLDDRFRLLTGGARTSLPRQRTLEAAVAWSYDLLDEPQRRLFERLSVFAGGFTLAAAEQVCAGDPIDASDVLDLLSGLVERSLVVHEQPGPPSRYRMLETTRAYGKDRLVDSGMLASLRDAHLAWIDSFVHTAKPHLDGPDQEQWLDAVAVELDDVRAALSWALAGGDTVTGLACAATLYRYWYVRAVREGRMWLDRLLAQAAEAPPKILAKALYAAGELASDQGDHEVARSRHEQALRLYREVGNRHGEAWALHGLGIAEWGLGRTASAGERLHAALDLFRELGDPVGMAFALQVGAGWELAFGDVATAGEYVDEHSKLVRPTGIAQLIAHANELSAYARWRQSNDPALAREGLREALRLHHEIGSVFCMAHCLEGVAGLAVDMRRPDVAARLLGATDAVREAAGTPVPPYEHLLYDDTWEGARSALGEERFAAELARGRELDLGAAVDEALAVLGDT